MSRNQSIAKVINSIKRVTYEPKRDNMIIGVVKSTDPLEVEIQQGVIITEPHLVLGEALRPHNVSMPHIHEYNGNTESTGGSLYPVDTFVDFVATNGAKPATLSDSHSHEIKEQRTEDVHKIQKHNEKCVTITMYPPLHASDEVLMFAMNDFQRFYIAERTKIGSENTDYDA